MSKTITVSVADKVEGELREEYTASKGDNFSEFVEEILRIGLYYHQKEKEEEKKGD